MTNETTRMTALKNKADMLKITYHPSIGEDKLKEKIDAKLAELPEKDPVDSGKVPLGAKVVSKMTKHKEASELKRIRLVCMDPNKKDWPGEIFSVGNSTVGFFKKYIPYGTEWHVPRIIFETIKTKKFQTFINHVDSRGNKTKLPKLVNAYNIEELDPLTPEELANLAKAQAASGRTED